MASSLPAFCPMSRAPKLAILKPVPHWVKSHRLQCPANDTPPSWLCPQTDTGRKGNYHTAIIDDAASFNDADAG